MNHTRKRPVAVGAAGRAEYQSKGTPRIVAHPHTPAPESTLNIQTHDELLGLSLVIGIFADLPEETRHEIAEAVSMLGRPVGSLRAAELANLIGPAWDAAAQREVE